MQGSARQKAVWGARGGVLIAAGAAVVLTAGCGKMAREGQASSYIQVKELSAASGGEPDKFGGTLYSDVVTVVEDVPTVYSDLAKVTMTLAMKDPGSAANPTEPTATNAITITRYRVRYIRADGHNTQGVDVPYAFDGALTFTVGKDETTSPAFEVVRHVAKKEAPLGALATGATIINTIAEVTFYGHDNAGREVTTVGTLGVDFGNFADPDK